ncbi:hypothetical protein D9619_002461 [Psilocybe cf. subviscida]|uniref:CBM21 domain-containing protein n=1 Tax=Psilocybe cf. subviscida TaxID=2480587 RepID=A0A8H5AW78_9AGAR|nr:hypothetical protein D9619_002461 [Psilocybe cf. subviscida]
MPYSTPATPTSPSAALPTLSAGRPGHRRSYSHISLPDSTMATPTSSSSSASSSASSSTFSSPEIPSTMHTSTSSYGSGAYASLGSLPRRRSASSHSITTSQNMNLNDIMNSPAMTALQANANGKTPAEPSPTKKPTFQLGHDDDDDDSSSDETNKRNGGVTVSSDNAKNVSSYPSSSSSYKPKSGTHPRAKQSDTDDDGRALPPLRLKQRPTHVHGHHVPFPRTASPRNSPRNSPRSSPRHSPTGSPSASHATLPTQQTPGPSALSHNVYLRPSLAHHGRSVSSSGSITTVTSPGTATLTSPKLVAPPMVRTVSSPVLLLSNGKPLKSSLKGSSSSGSIPFPSQSMVPSRMGVYLAPPVDGISGHQRVASAPTSPMMSLGAEGEQAQVPFPSPSAVQMPMSPLVLVNEDAENKNAGSRMPSFGSALSSLPSLDTSSNMSASSSTSSISSMTSDTPGSATGTPEYLLSPLNMPGFADDTTNAHVQSHSYDVLHGYHPTGYQGHQHTQSLSFPNDHASQPTTPVAKTVHFPTPDSGGLATVKLYNKGGRPASLLRLGEETETETEGEGSAREGPARWGGWMSGFGGFGAAGKAWSRSGSSGGGSTSSHVGVHGRQGAQNQAGYPFPKVAASASPLAPQLTRGDSGMPMKRMQEVTTVETVVEVDGANSSPVPARGAQRGEGNVYLESIGFAKGTASTPADRLLLEGTMLVRNVAYLKTVAVRFTLDDWHTTTDVLARYERSLPSLPTRFVRAAAGELVRSHSLAEQNRGRVCHPDDVDQDVGESSTGDEDQPAWDRFRFDIALGAHGQSLSTLEGRVMWLVGRYSAGVDIADTVVAVAGTGSNTASAVPQSASVERLDEVLAARKPTQEWWDNNAGCNYRVGFVKKEIVTRKQVDAGAEEQQSKEKTAEAMMKEVEKANGAYRRGLHLSAPYWRVFSHHIPRTRPGSPDWRQDVTAVVDGDNRPLSVYPASSPPAKSYPAPPQISSSASFPGPNSPPATTYARYQQQQQQQQQKQHQEAVVQSTMARLKKLNLRNYAAPTKYTPPPPAPERLPEDMVPSTSTSTSANSTPLQTPTHMEDDERERALGSDTKNDGTASAGYVDVQAPRSDDDPDRTPTFQGALARPTWGTSESEAGSELGSGMNIFSPTFMGSMSMMMENGFPASMPTNSSSLSAPGLDPGMMGSSPPFSAMTSADVGASLGNSRAAKSAMAANNNSALYWPWGSGEGDKPTTANAAATGKENEPVGPSSVLASTPPLSAPVASLLSDIQEKSTSGAAVGSHIAPPQRRRGVHHHQKQLSQQLSSDGSSSSLSSLTNGTGSGSDSQPYPGNRPRHTRTTSSSSPRTSPQIPSASFGSSSGISAPAPVRNGSPTMWGLRANSPRPGSPRPNGGYSFGSSLSVGPSREGGTRSPLRLSPVNSSTAIDALVSNTSKANANGARTPSPLTSATSFSAPSAPVPSTSSVNSSGMPTSDSAPPASPGAGQDDAVYQAFVRQWCFAQAPGPSVGASAGAAGTQTPVGTTPRGEVGPRLVVS